MRIACVLLQGWQNWSLQDCAGLLCGLSEQPQRDQKTWAEIPFSIGDCQGCVGVSCELPAAA